MWLDGEDWLNRSVASNKISMFMSDNMFLQTGRQHICVLTK